MSEPQVCEYGFESPDKSLEKHMRDNEGNIKEIQEFIRSGDKRAVERIMQSPSIDLQNTTHDLLRISVQYDFSPATRALLDKNLRSGYAMEEAILFQKSNETIEMLATADCWVNSDMIKLAHECNPEAEQILQRHIALKQHE